MHFVAGHLNKKVVETASCFVLFFYCRIRHDERSTAMHATHQLHTFDFRQIGNRMEKVQKDKKRDML